MDNFEIVVESSSDLSFELRKRFNIYNEYLKGVIYLPNNELLADLDWNNISSDQFYKIGKEKQRGILMGINSEQSLPVQIYKLDPQVEKKQGFFSKIRSVFKK